MLLRGDLGFLDGEAFGGGLQGEGAVGLGGDDAGEGAAVFELEEGHAVVGGDDGGGVEDVLEEVGQFVAVAAGEFGAEGAAFAVEFVAGGAGSGEDGFAFFGVGLGDEVGGEALGPLGEFGFFGFGGVAQFAPGGGEFLGEVGVVEAADLAGLVGGDGVCGDGAFGDGVEEGVGVGGAGDEGGDGGLLLLVTADGPRGEEGFGDVFVVVGGEGGAGGGAENFVVDQTAHDSQQLRLGAACETGEGIAACVGIAVSVFDDGDEFVRSASGAEDEGKVLDHRRLVCRWIEVSRA